MEKPDYLIDNADGTVTVKLARGVTIDGAKVMALTMREPTVGDQLAAMPGKASRAQEEIALFANLCTIAPGDVSALKMKDYGRLQEAYTGFLD